MWSDQLASAPEYQDSVQNYWTRDNIEWELDIVASSDSSYGVRPNSTLLLIEHARCKG